MDSNHDRVTPSHVEEPPAGAKPDEFRSGDHAVPVLVNELKGPLGTACVQRFTNLTMLLAINALRDLAWVRKA
jgi:hypothetical protein